MNTKILLSAVILTALFSNLALAIPIGHQFYGTVTLNGSPAPDGTTIVAKVNGVEVASTATKGGKYGYDPLFIISLDSKYSGNTIYFFVNGNQANENSQFCLEYACITRLDLTATGGTIQPPGPGGPSGPSGPGGTSSGGVIGGTTGGTISGAQNQTCQEKWACSDWSKCENGVQTRSCNDQNNCGTRNNEPFSSQPCSAEEMNETEKPETTGAGITGFFLGLSTTDWITSMIIGLIAAIIIIFFFKRKK